MRLYSVIRIVLLFPILFIRFTICVYNSSKNTYILADAPGDPSLVLILKWGGELTPAGRIQAEELGRIFRCMYPGGQSRHIGG